MTAITPEAIDALLPQTQCGQCGYGACKPYAQAIAAGEVKINRCPPGGDETIRELATLLSREILPLDATRGVHKPAMLALIDEPQCIGCALCLAACPVDAIVGAAKRMHTVIADQCTGCELCLPVCPVDCIHMTPAPEISREQKKQLADHARERYEFRQFRLEREKRERALRLKRKSPAVLCSP
ncbi:MAG: RnfABCDGE type electron transport complex subunit B [Burkholderiales bacterium]